MVFSAYSMAAMGEAVNNYSEKYSLEAQDQRKLQRQQALLQVKAAEQQYEKNNLELEEFKNNTGYRNKVKQNTLANQELANEQAQETISKLQLEIQNAKNKTIGNKMLNVAVAYNNNYQNGVALEKNLVKDPDVKQYLDELGYISFEPFDKNSTEHRALLMENLQFENEEQLNNYLANEGAEHRYTVRQYKDENGNPYKVVQDNLLNAISLGAPLIPTETLLKIQKTKADIEAAKSGNGMFEMLKDLSDTKISALSNVFKNNPELAKNVPSAVISFFEEVSKINTNNDANSSILAGNVVNKGLELMKTFKDNKGNVADITKVPTADLDTASLNNLAAYVEKTDKLNNASHKLTLPKNEVVGVKNIIQLAAELAVGESQIGKGYTGIIDRATDITQYIWDGFSKGDKGRSLIRRITMNTAKLLFPNTTVSKLDDAMDLTGISVNSQPKIVAAQISENLKEVRTILEKHNITDKLYSYAMYGGHIDNFMTELDVLIKNFDDFSGREEVDNFNERQKQKQEAEEQKQKIYSKLQQTNELEDTSLKNKEELNNINYLLNLNNGGN